jgi:cyclopropane fatty-acyl-phospholipid synthase-like methyltransferase
MHALHACMQVRSVKRGLTVWAMQVITIPDSRYAAYCASPDFIKEHIFPGGHLPSCSAMTACASSSHLVAVGLRDIGPDYAITLRAWRKNWIENWQRIVDLGYSEVFMRKCAPVSTVSCNVQTMTAS